MSIRLDERRYAEELKRGNPILRPFRHPLRNLEKFFSASANDSRPLLYASLLFLGHHGSPVVSSTASVSLAWFHHLRKAQYDHSGASPRSSMSFDMRQSLVVGESHRPSMRLQQSFLP